jgi:hypothetical protein
VDAPNRRVYREELWDVVRASGGDRNGRDVLAPAGPAEAPASGLPLPEPPAAQPPLPEPVITAAEPADVTASSATA